MQFNVTIADDLESRTNGCFQTRAGALFVLSARLALKDVQCIREQYTNFFQLFKDNGLAKLTLNTAELSEPELERILLSANAKKFAIAREIIYANSLRITLLLLTPAISFSLGACLSRLLQPKLGAWISLAFGLILTAFIQKQLLNLHHTQLALNLDREAAKIDAEHETGSRDYLRSSIELCKLLHRLTKEHLDVDLFEEQGNFLNHAATYTERLKCFEESKSMKPGPAEEP